MINAGCAAVLALVIAIASETDAAWYNCRVLYVGIYTDHSGTGPIRVNLGLSTTPAPNGSKSWGTGHVKGWQHAMRLM